MVHPRAWLERRRARTEADYWIRHGFDSRFQWRVDELTAPRERKLCARSLRGVLGELDGTKLPGAAPLRTGQLRPHIGLLEAIEARLLDDAAGRRCRDARSQRAPDEPGQLSLHRTGRRRVVPARRPRRAGGSLMFDLAALGIAAVCFAFCFFFLFVMEKV